MAFKLDGGILGLRRLFIPEVFTFAILLRFRVLPTPEFPLPSPLPDCFLGVFLDDRRRVDGRLEGRRRRRTCAIAGFKPEERRRRFVCLTIIDFCSFL